MQARYYDPVIGRFYSNDPIGFTGEVDTFNRYSYVANNPYKYTDPNGEAKVFTWDAGDTPTGKSRAGHASILTDDGVYLSMFPTNGNNSKAEFHTFEQDVSIYGRQPDMVFDVDLPQEALASLFANGIKSDESQTWRLNDNNCATVTLKTLNAGGANLPVHDYNSPVQVDSVLNMGAEAPKGLTGIPVVRVFGRLDSKKLDEMKDR